MGIIEVHDLTFSYSGGDTVIDGLSLSIERGSFVVILGRNGSGKSTLAKHFNAINLPVGGKVYAAGFDTSDGDRLFDIRSRVGMVFQNPDNQMVAALIEDEVAFAPENLGIEPKEIQKRVDEALETVGMSKYARSAAANLSGGQKQRIAIAGVLAMKPQVMILDEATAMLDPRGRREVMKAAERINRETGTTIVHITHSMEEAVRADRVIVMDGGRIIADGEPREIFSQPRRMYEAGLDVPQITQAAYELNKAGISVRPNALTIEELYEDVTRIR